MRRLTLIATVVVALLAVSSASAAPPLREQAVRWAERHDLAVTGARDAGPRVVHLRLARQIDAVTVEHMVLTFKPGRRGRLRVWDPMDGWVTSAPWQSVEVD